MIQIKALAEIDTDIGTGRSRARAPWSAVDEPEEAGGPPPPDEGGTRF